MMLDVILITYLAGLLLERLHRKIRTAVLVLFLICDLGLLAVFKYAGLFAASINTLAGSDILHMIQPAMPIGISFYTFQSISYGIDVYRGKYPAERNLLNFALYISFFPQLIAGPIVRYEDISRELKERRISIDGFADGAFRFILGLGKKVLIADRLFALCKSMQAVNDTSVVLAWMEGIAYLLYVYFDFSGYSDMAIGLGSCFGFEIPENFNYPLISGSIKEFWRRWHISLGAWFRDYLYIPLGGNRNGLIKQLLNLLIVWALTGLWHGASWNYVIWGLAFGIILIAETIWDKLFKNVETLDNRKNIHTAFRIVRVISVQFVTVIIFVWFRFQNFDEAIRQIGNMFGTVSFWTPDTLYYLKSGFVILLIALFGATPLPKRIAERIENTKIGVISFPFLRIIVLTAVLLVSTAYLVDGSYSPFLYFRF